tara:strand:- start:62 stop:940 length:879 start_codon:yes stop_codon:yes gene_type:complete
MLALNIDINMLQNQQKINPYAPTGPSYGPRKPTIQEAQWNVDNKVKNSGDAYLTGKKSDEKILAELKSEKATRDRIQSWYDKGILDVFQTAKAASSGYALTPNVYATMADDRASEMNEAERLADAGELGKARNVMNEAWDHGVKNQKRSSGWFTDVLKTGAGLAAGALTGGFGSSFLLGSAAPSAGTALSTLGRLGLNAGFAGTNALAARNEGNKSGQFLTSPPRSTIVNILRDSPNIQQQQANLQQLEAVNNAQNMGFTSGGQFTKAGQGFTSGGGQFTRNTNQNGKNILT